MNKKLRNIPLKILFACLFVLGLAHLPTTTFSNENEQHDVTILTKEIRKVPGPKRTIAVQRFSSSGGFGAYYGSWDVGAGLEAMLVTALVETDQFIVVERANLGDILSEQELAASGMTGKGESVEVGQLNSAQLLIYGAVTEFETREKSGGFNIGTSIGGKKLGLGRSKAEGSIGLDIRLIDASSGRILKSKHIKEAMIAKGFDISGGYKGISMGDRNFVKTPIGQAAREAITKVVELITKEAAKSDWTGQVVEYDGQDIYINAGSLSGIKEGDQFVIKKIIKKLTDPTTGELLMLKTEKLGMVKVGTVAEKIAFGEYTSVSHNSPIRGDMAVLRLD